ncbi:acylneuraminate cytidylyltransferase family protein [Candidatus Pelagibacter sp.]|nr:acylneuraminate cytidylyltransferase family protein [Candidatus Pelagibacter sp.]
MNIIALIPARAGSKSIKNKNIKKLKNKYLIYYPIETAKKIKIFDRIIVSTDSKKIAKIAKNGGAEIPFFRPKKISKNSSLDIEYIKHFISKMNLKNKNTIIVILRPTTPIRDHKIIKKAINSFKSGKYDSLRSVSISKESPFKMWIKKNKNLILPFMGEKNIKLTNFPRQKLKKTYWQNGYVDITKVETIMKYGNELGKKVKFFEIDHEIVEIDYKSQLKVAQFKTILRKKDGKIYPS